MINLRPHHLLCLIGFDGLGYSEEFISNMAKVKQKISIKDPEIRLVESSDDICKDCPRISDCEPPVLRNDIHHDKLTEKDGKRTNDPLPDILDARVVNYLDLALNKKYQASYLYFLISRTVKPEDIQNICEGCEWLEKSNCEASIDSFLEGKHEFKRFT